MLSRLKVKGDFARDVVTLMSGTTVAQAIPMALSPVFSRIYSPTDFGIYALFTSVAAVVSVVATGRYELAVMLPETPEDAINLVVGSLGLSLVVGLISLCIIMVLRESIASALGNPALAVWLYFIPPLVAFTGSYQALNYWHNRYKRYSIMGMSRVTQNLSMSAVQLAGLIPYAIKESFLVAGYAFGQLVSMVYLGYHFVRTYPKECRITRASIFRQFRRFKDYPIKSVPGGFINTLLTQTPIFLLGLFYSPELVGIYLMAARVLNIPMVFLGNSFSQVFYRKATERAREGTLHSFVVRTTTILVGIIAIPMIVIMLWGKPLFALVFGSNWVESGTFAEILAPMTLMGFVYSCQSTIMNIVNKLEYQIYFSGTLIILETAGFAAGYYIFHSHTLSMVFLAVAGTLVYGYNVLWVLSVAKKAVVAG